MQNTEIVMPTGRDNFFNEVASCLFCVRSFPDGFSGKPGFKAFSGRKNDLMMVVFRSFRGGAV